MTEYITTGTCRLVQGDLFAPQTKDRDGNPLVGRDKITPRSEWFIGIAIPKGPEWDRIWSHIWGVGSAAFPAGEYNAPGFAWKYADGDATGNVGKDGFAGCMILRCTNGFAPTIWDNSPQPQQIVDPAMGPRGYFVQVQLNPKGNAPSQSPGVYMNWTLARVVAPGPLIQAGPSASEVFGAPAPMPPGALAAPPAPAPIALLRFASRPSLSATATICRRWSIMRQGR